MRSPAAARAPRSLILLVAGITLVPLAILLWLGWRLVAQDRALEQQQIAQRVERGADLVASALLREISSSEQQLFDADGHQPAGVVVITRRGEHFDVKPSGAVAYWPVVPPLTETTASTFARADDLEFRQQSYDAALAEFRRLSASPNRPIQAGALLRLGRGLRRQGRTDDALDAYARLLQHDEVAIGGVPAGLVASYARCRIFEEDGRVDELRREARELAGGLRSGRWRVTGPVYSLYAADAAKWSDATDDEPAMAEILAEAVATLWGRWQSLNAISGPSSGREHLDIGGHTLTVVWKASESALHAFVATPGFVETNWLRSIGAIEHEQQIAVELRRSDGQTIWSSGGSTSRAPVVRAPTDTSLPWNIAVASVEPPPENRAFAARRRWLVVGFVLLVGMTLTAAGLIVRSIRREIALARHKSDFVAAVSHEFRTPLTSLRQFTEMLREQPALDDGRRRLAYDAQARATDRLTDLVESLLDFGRMEAGARRYRFEPHDCSDLVRRVVDDFRATNSASTGHEIALHADDTAQVEVDDEAMTRAVRNLLDNAVKYSPESSAVEVAVGRSNGHLAISVRDHGIGIPADERPKIFAKFQRGEQARVRGIKGTGIGLAMVDEIVTAHHGRVDVVSEPGAGSTFTILLPLSSTSPVSKHQRQSPIPHP